MKKTIHKIISISLASSALLVITAKQSLADRSSYSLKMAVDMAQFRFGQKNRNLYSNVNTQKSLCRGHYNRMQCF